MLSTKKCLPYYFKINNLLGDKPGNINMPNGFFEQYMQKRSKTTKKNITIEFYTIKLVWVPNFSFNK